jgi:hypothetical protein
MKNNCLCLLMTATLAASSLALAHHSAVMFDTSREVAVEGTVTRYDWRNPHVYMAIETVAADGRTVEQPVEVGAPSVLAPLGLTSDSVQIGERVTIHGSPNRTDPTRIMLGRYLTREDGSQLPLNIAAPSLLQAETARATSLAGTWFSPLDGFRGFSRSTGSWNFTERGRAERETWTVAQASYADCVPVTAPTLMIYPVATTIELRDDAVVFNVDWMTSQRIVYIDGREHPDTLEPSLHGHSVGHWEGDTLVVDTVGFAAHSEGLTLGVPAGPRKHTVERFSLDPDGRHLNYEFVLEDPDYLAEPLTYRSQLEYRPDIEPTNLACDLETARRYRTEE